MSEPIVIKINQFLTKDDFRRASEELKKENQNIIVLPAGCDLLYPVLIKCKDCQYWMKNPYRESSVFGLCFKHKDIAIATDETDWCSWAERRTDE